MVHTEVFGVLRHRGVVEMASVSHVKKEASCVHGSHMGRGTCIASWGVLFVSGRDV